MLTTGPKQCLRCEALSGTSRRTQLLHAAVKGLQRRRNLRQRRRLRAVSCPRLCDRTAVQQRHVRRSRDDAGPVATQLCQGLLPDTGPSERQLTFSRPWQ